MEHSLNKPHIFMANILYLLHQPSIIKKVKSRVELPYFYSLSKLTWLRFTREMRPFPPIFLRTQRLGATRKWRKLVARTENVLNLISLNLMVV